MKAKLISKLPDPVMQGAPAALLRAAKRAREVARATGTAVVYMRDGKLIEERVSPLREKTKRLTKAGDAMTITGRTR